MIKNEYIYILYLYIYIYNIPFINFIILIISSDDYLSSCLEIAQHRMQAKNNAKICTPTRTQLVRSISCHLSWINCPNFGMHPSRLSPSISFKREVLRIRSTSRSVTQREPTLQQECGIR